MPSAVTTRCTSWVTSNICVRRLVRTRIDCIKASANGSGNGNDVMLPGFLRARQPLEFAQAAGAETQEKWKEGEIAGLQPFVRIEEIFEEKRVGLDDLFVAVERLPGFRAQFFHLVADAPFGAGDRALDRGIHLANRFVQVFDALLDLPKAALERARQLFGDVGGVHLLPQRL